ncbi:UDP-glucose 6-dehydrogenase TuaD [Paenibacillus apiarius]|uniref:UDP-glucose 6-dehydrogenase TuaD n=1 Tax=Paenibacillus apiarius TaxID=46240 RepID=UPI00197FC5C6|nr:UDP-glucose/GDP-mannose dehydrogenase family protein [Paenibacillus apiarius]MBN3523442.1 UDP-glucose/GDP-mannose dehydrogenase family protein [Paenibacillus apiarius]
MNNICVLGTGYVGLVSGTCFAEIGHNVICCDVDGNKIAKLQRGEIPIYEPGLADMVQSNVKSGRLRFTTDIAQAIREADIIYIAVGTPMSDTGEADLTYVMAVARTIGQQLNGYKIIVTKSTVPVGTGKKIAREIREHMIDKSMKYDVVSNPEFLREGTAIEDCLSMERAVIGASNPEAALAIARLHEPLHTKIFITDIESAEMIKYAANSFLAIKISFINEIANICERVGADVTDIAIGIGLDSRIGDKFLQAGIGYGGSCFPKDTEALKFIAEQNGIEARLIQAAIETNDKQRMVVVDKLIEGLGDISGYKIAILGLAFKPNTDDMRYAPSLTIIPELMKRGACIAAYDPIAQYEALKWLPAGVEYVNDVYEAVTDSDAAIILTEWEEIKWMDLHKVMRLMKQPILIDGRNCFSLESMQGLGYYYASIGRKVVTAEKVLA